MTSHTTIPSEFQRFADALMSNAPPDYVPWFFPVLPGAKRPDVQAIASRAPAGANNPFSTTAPHARLTIDEALDRLKAGGNIGLMARRGDPLVLVDIDHPKHIPELKPTLLTQSRKRCGAHGIYWLAPGERVLPANIGTSEGEVRSLDQYTLAPGSYVPLTNGEIAEMVQKGLLTQSQAEKIADDPHRGNYTLFDDQPPQTLTFKELPQFFQDAYHADPHIAQQRREPRQRHNAEKKGEFDILDFVPTAGLRLKANGDYQGPHPVHGSSKAIGANFVVSPSLNVWHCFRHGSGGGPLEWLAVQKGLISCEDARPGALRGPLFKRVLALAYEKLGRTDKVVTIPLAEVDW